MKTNDLDGHSSKNSEYEELIERPFLYGVFVPQMTKKELVDFYLYVIEMGRQEPDQFGYKSAAYDLEQYDIIKRLLNNKVTDEMLADPTPVGYPVVEEPKILTDEDQVQIAEMLKTLEEKRKKPLVKRLIKIFRG